MDYHSHAMSVIEPFDTANEALLDCKRRLENLPDLHCASVETLWCESGFVGISRLRVVRATGKALLMPGMTAPRQWRCPIALSSSAFAWSLVSTLVGLMNVIERAWLFAPPAQVDIGRPSLAEAGGVKVEHQA